jgi:hypothetical protein
MNAINKATALQTQILCLNTLYKHSKEITQNETAFLLPLIGKDILKVDGSFKAKYEHEKKAFKYNVNEFGFDFWVDTHYYFTAKYGKLSIDVITTVSGGGSDKNGVNANHSQQRQCFDLFVLDNGILADKCADSELLNTVYTESEILVGAEKVKAAAKQYEATLSSVPYLFRQTLRLQRLAN